MSQTNKEPPSFFIVPSEKRDYKSSVKLGNVIYDITAPHRVLFRPEKAKPSALDISDVASPKTLKNYVIGNDNSGQTKVGLFAKILEFFGVGGELSHQSDKDATAKYSIKSVTFELLDPTPAFLGGLKEQQSIIAHLQDGNPPCAFLITGVVTATGVVFESTEAKGKADEASLGINAQGAPLGFMSRRSKTRKLTIDWEDPGPTVLAFRVQKLELRDDELTAEDEAKGAFFDGDDELPDSHEVEFDAKLERRDVAGLVQDTGDDDIVNGGFNLYLPDE